MSNMSNVTNNSTGNGTLPVDTTTSFFGASISSELDMNAFYSLFFTYAVPALVVMLGAGYVLFLLRFRWYRPSSVGAVV